MRAPLVVKTWESFHVKIITVIMEVSFMRLPEVRDSVFMVESSLEKSRELTINVMKIYQGLSFFICKTWVIIILSCLFLKDIFVKTFLHHKYFIRIKWTGKLFKVIYMCKKIYFIAFFQSKSSKILSWQVLQM